MFESADVLHRQRNRRLDDEATSIPSVAHDSVLEYPTLPPNKALQFKVAPYPRGISSLALNARLSVQFLNFFGVFFDWMTEIDVKSGPHGAMTELAHDILAMPRLNFIERLLAVAILSYCNWIERTQRMWSNFASEHLVEGQIGVLRKAGTEAGVWFDDRRHAFAWSCFMIRDTTTRGSGPWTWADSHIVLAISRIQIDAKEMQRLDGAVLCPAGFDSEEYTLNIN